MGASSGQGGQVEELLFRVCGVLHQGYESDHQKSNIECNPIWHSGATPGPGPAFEGLWVKVPQSLRQFRLWKNHKGGSQN